MSNFLDQETGEILTVAPHMRTAWNYDRDIASAETALLCPEEENRTQQQFAEEVDINTIVRRFGLTGQLPVNPQMAQVGDFTAVTDFQDAMQRIARARAEFMTFPPELREQFGNDPAKMLAFLSDEKNRDRAIELGLVAKPPEKTRDVVQAVDELREMMKPKA